jgi:hypothetical protein
MRIFILLTIGICALTAYAATDETADTAVSPWQGTWTGSENSSFGGKVQIRAKIKVTNKTISGTWNVHAGGLKPITGQVDGTEATITILQGGSTIKATLVDENTFKYSGIRGYGTLTRQIKQSAEK